MAKIDSFIEAVAAWPRRTICAYLLNSSEDLFTFEELLTHLVTEARTAPADVRPPSTRRADLARRLRSEYLPRLASEDVIEYDRNANLVRPGPALATIETVFPTLESEFPRP
ncbi:DUF7344 domain-containing protein [Halorientalis brevis]|nr:hypothetical protein [Halorientalis brevis]